MAETRRHQLASGVVRCCAGSATFAAAVGMADRVLPARPGLLTALTYHRVDEPHRRPDLYPGLISATPDELDRQLAFLAGHRHLVSLAELLEVRAGRADLPPNSVLVTFDDAYLDFAAHAWPLLQRHRVPVTLFVPTAYPDQDTRSFWWDRLHHALATAPARTQLDTPAGPVALRSPEERSAAYKLVRGHLKAQPHTQAMAEVQELTDALEAPAPAPTVLGWDALRDLAAAGVTLAPHSRTHPMLDRLRPEALDDEVTGSLVDLEREVGPTPRAFAYPSGQFDDGVVGSLATAEFDVAFTTERGNNDLRRPDWLRLRRVNVGSSTTLGLLRAQLLPVPLPPRKPARRQARPPAPRPRARSLQT